MQLRALPSALSLSPRSASLQPTLPRTPQPPTPTGAPGCGRGAPKEVLGGALQGKGKGVLAGPAAVCPKGAASPRELLFITFFASADPKALDFSRSLGSEEPAAARCPLPSTSLQSPPKPLSHLSWAQACLGHPTWLSWHSCPRAASLPYPKSRFNLSRQQGASFHGSPSHRH